MISRALLVVLLQAATPEARLREILDGQFSDLPEDRRVALSRSWDRACRDAARQGHDPERVLEAVEGRLIQARALSGDLRRTYEMMAETARRRLPPETPIPDFPAALVHRERDAHLDAVSAYLEEAVARPAASEAEQARIRQQVEALAAEVRTAALSRIHGPWREKIVDRCVAGAVRNLLGPELGDPVLGGMTRSLGADEMAALTRRIRETAVASPPIEASSAEDEKIAGGGPLSLSGRTPAFHFAMDLAMGIYAFGDLNYPKFMRALDEQDRVLSEAGEWLQASWKPLEKALAERGETRFRIDLPAPAPRSSRTGTEVDGPAAPRRDIPSREAPLLPSRDRRAAILLALLAVAAVAGLLWKASRRRPVN